MKKISKILLAILIFNFFVIANVLAVEKTNITVNEREKYSVAVNKVEYTSIEQAGLQLREGLKKRKNIISVTFITSTKLDDSIFKQVVNEAVKHTGVPTEGDYIYWQCSEWEADSDYEYLNGIYYYTLTYKFSYYTTYEQEKEMDIEIANLLNTLDLSGTDYEKITKIYNYMCNNIVYHYSSKDEQIYSSYGALINKKAVCQGFATLFYRLALENNIDARVIAGIADGGPHGWNIVKIGNEYYNIDTTWDVNNIVSGYKYCMVSDNNFKDHKRDNKFSTNEFYAIYPMGVENCTLDSSKVNVEETEIIKQDYNLADLESEISSEAYIENSEVVDVVLKDTIESTRINTVWTTMIYLVRDFDYSNLWKNIIFEAINYNYMRIGKNESEV